MKFFKKNIFHFFLSVFIVLFCGFTFIIFKPLIILDKLDDLLLNIKQKEFLNNINFNDISGNFIQGFKINNINFKDQGEIIFSSDEILIAPSLFKLVLGEIYFSKIKISNPYLNYDLIKIKEENKSTFNYKFYIDDLIIIDGKLIFYKQNINIATSTTFEYYKSFKIDINHLDIFPANYNELINVSSGKLSFNKSTLDLKNINILSDSLIAKVNAYIDFRNFGMSYGNVRLKNFNFKQNNSPEIYIKNLKSTFSDRQFILESDIKIDQKNINNIYIKLKLDDEFIDVVDAQFNYNNNLITSNGEYNFNKNIFLLSTELDNFKIQNINIKKGNLKIENIGSIKDVNIDFKINDFTIDSTLIPVINGSINYIDNQLTSSNINLYKDSSVVNISDLNFINLNDFNLKGNIDLDHYKNNIIANKYGVSLLNGNADFNYSHSLDDRSLKLKYNLTKGIIYEKKLSSFNGLLNINLIDEKIEIENWGHIKGFNTTIYNWDSIYYHIYSINEDILNFEFYSKSDMGDSIVFKGESINKYQYHISKFNGLLKQNDFTISPFNVEKENNYYSFKPVNCKFKNSHISLSGKVKNRSYYDINATIQNLNLIDLYSVFGKHYRLKGLVRDASFNIENYYNNNKPISTLFSYISIVDGSIDDIEFTELSLKSTYRDRRFLISDLSLTSELGKIKGDGWLNISFASSDSLFNSNDQVNINLLYDNINIKNFNRYLPWGYNSYGLLSGDIKINGTIRSPEISSKFKIQDPILDKIKGDFLTGNLVYNNQKLHFRNLLLKSQSSRYSGFGYFPLDINLINNERINVNENKMDFVFTGLSNNVDFLPEYFEIIDSLTTYPRNNDSSYAYSLELLISGSLKKPIRNGKLIVDKGILYIDPINEPIKDINGHISIYNNQLSIKHLNGSLINRKNNNIPLITSFKNILKINSLDKKENIKISGDINLKDFFNPDYNLNLAANSINLTSSYDLFEGVGDADINIYGKDTIYISGKFVPDPYNFTIINLDDNNSYDAPNIYSNQIINYDIYIPIKDGIKIETDNVNLLFDGDINISKIGNESYNFSGKANIIDGKFYDNQGNVFQNTYGNIILAPTDNNPYIDLHAQTAIEDNIIDVSFVGFIDDPILRFDSQEYTQTEIIKILTFGDMENFNDTEQAGNLLSNYFENEIERNITKYSNLDEFQLTSNRSLIETIEGEENFDLKLIVGKQVSNKIYLNTKLDLNDINKSQYEGTYRINHNTSIIGGLNEDNHWHLSYRIKYYY